MSYRYPEEGDELGGNGDGLAPEYDGEALGQEEEDEDQATDGVEEGIEYGDSAQDAVVGSANTETKNAEFLFSLFVVPSKHKDSSVMAIMDKGIRLVHADVPTDFVDGGFVLPNKVEVCNVTNNFFKYVTLKFHGLQVKPYNKEHSKNSLPDASLVVPGAPTPFKASKIKHRVVMERRVHDDMKNYVKKFGEYSLDNLQTKGLERNSTMTFVPGSNGWIDADGVRHNRHPVYTIAKATGKYAEDPEGRLMVPNKDFDHYAAMTTDILQQHQQPFNMKSLAISAMPFNFGGEQETWTNMSELTMPVADSKLLDKQYNITGTIKIKYH